MAGEHVHDENCDHEHNHAPAQMPMNFDQETQKAIQEVQILEHNFEHLMQQKNMFVMENNETDLAIKEVEESEGDVFKIVGNQVLIKKEKGNLVEDLKHKKELLGLRLKNIEKQEKEFSDRIEKLREDIMKKISPQG